MRVWTSLLCLLPLVISLTACREKEPGPVVVWESNRSGAWRIWRAEVDGSNPRQVSPDKPEGEHMGPVISPDGRNVAYRVTLDPKKPGPLFVQSLISGRVRKLYETAQATGRGNRVAVWRNHDQLFFLDEHKRTRLIDLRDGSITPPLIHGKQNVLPNPGFTAAFDGFHYYSLSEEGQIQNPVYKFGGCEAFMTRDNQWGYRVNGAGGPFTAVDLQTGKTRDLLKKDDPRLPKERNYIYFPKISVDQRMLSFAASPDQHDHYKSDYDIFIMEMNPDTLEITGPPVRIAAHPKGDKYPDVWIGPPPATFAGSRGIPQGIPPEDLTVPLPENAEMRVFDWVSHHEPARAWSGKQGMQVQTPDLRGHVQVLRDGGLAFQGGSLTFPKVGSMMGEVFRKTEAFTLVAGIESYSETQQGPARIVSLSDGTGARNFTLGQNGGDLVLRVRTPRTGGNGSNPQVTLAPLPKKPFHLAVTVDSDGIKVYIDGKQVAHPTTVKADFSNWEEMTFLFGNETSDDRPWKGALRGVSLYASVLSAPDLLSKAEAWGWQQREFPQVPRARVKANVLAVSPAWTPEEIQPYLSGLSAVRVHIQTSDSDSLKPKQVISVLMWSLLNEQALPLPSKGETLDLVLEPFEAWGILKDQPIQDEASELTDLRWMSLPSRD